MPEIKLGSSKNMKNINLGSKEIEEVRLGSVLVWQNNLVPQIVLTTPENGEYGDLNFPIGVTVASNVDIVFSVRDLDPLDTVVSYSVSGPPGFTDIPTTPISPPANPVEGLTFTIPDTLFPTSGEPTTNNVFTVRVTDQRNKFGEYTITVISVSVPPPTIVVTQEFGFYQYLTSPNPRSKTARWAITQPQETIDNGYNPQYSIDNINWVDLPKTISTSIPSIVELSTSTNCGGSSTVTVYCRSVKPGETTAVGNYASSTLRISPPPISFPVILNNCVYNQTRIQGFTTSQTCGGVIISSGNLKTGEVWLESTKYASTSTYSYTGTSFPQLNSIAPYRLDGKFRARYKIPFTIPSDPSTSFNFTCTGGDYRITVTSGPEMVSAGLSPNSIRGVVGTSAPYSLNNKGSDFIYTNFATGTPIASVSITSGFGNLSAQVSFDQVGEASLWRSTYSGYYRLANGDTQSMGGQTTRNFFRTEEP